MWGADGIGFWGTPVPGAPFPPYVQFKLGIGMPYPDGFFVPEGWVIDTLHAIRLGAVAAGDFGGQLLGFPKSKSQLGFIHGRELIQLDGKRTPVIVKDPPPGL